MEHRLNFRFVGWILLLSLPGAATAAPRIAPLSLAARPPAAASRSPLAFEVNEGQTDPAVRFLARAPGYRLFLTDDAVWMSAEGEGGFPPKEPVTISLDGAGPMARASGEGRLARATNYLIGADPKRWQRNVPSFSRVRYQDVYPGIDLVYYGNGADLEFDFEVAPGADPGQIRLRMSVASILDADGNLCLASSIERRLLAPEIYQETKGRRRRVAGRWVASRDADGRRSFGFEIGAYDRRLPLVIDPVLVYSTYLGGSQSEDLNAIAADPQGNVYVAGDTSSVDFPGASGGAQPKLSGNSDMFVTKIDPDGTTILYSTYLGGSEADIGYAIAVDEFGQAYVGGQTFSKDFPKTKESTIQPNQAGQEDGIVVKLDPTGSDIVFATFLGGSFADAVLGIALDSANNVYVTGFTSSYSFPGTKNSPIRSSIAGGQDAFAAKIASNGSTIDWATYLGSSGTDDGLAIAVDREGNALVGGYTEGHNFTGSAGSRIQSFFEPPSDGFVTKINRDGSAIVYSTYLGGPGNDDIEAIAVDLQGNAYVAGSTQSTAFPIVGSPVQTKYGGKSDAILAKIDPAGTAIVFSTYLGGTAEDFANGVALDSEGNAYVTGSTHSDNFPGASLSSIQSAPRGNGDAFVTAVSADGTKLLYSTYLGGSDFDIGTGIAVTSRSACIVGLTYSNDFHGTGTSPIQKVLRGDTDGFVARISAVDLSPRSVVAPIPAPATDETRRH